MNDIVKVAIIQAMATIFAASMAAGAVLYGSRRVVKSVNGIVTRLTDSKDETIRGKDEVIAVKDQRIAAVGESEHAKGVLEGKEHC